MVPNSKERLTCQKKFILDYLKSVNTHPSAEEIFLAVRERLPRISFGTVYRILKNLKEKGEILEIKLDVSHFDGDILPHAHFVCQKCKGIWDLSFSCQNCQKIKSKRLKVGKIKSWQILFYGLCKKCE